MNAIIALDVSLFKFFQHFVNPASHMQFLVIKTLSDLGVLVIVLALVGIWLWGTFTKDDEKKKTALDIFYPVLIAFIVYIVLNQLLPARPRPDLLTGIKPLFVLLPHNSFPSGHAVFAGAAAVAAFFTPYKKIAYTVLVFGVLMCIARVLSGVHYPFDVLAGYIIGMFVACGMVKWQKKSNFYQNTLRTFPVNILKKI